MTAIQTKTLKECEKFFEQGYAEANPPELQEVSLAIYRALAKGSPVNLDDIAKDLGLSHDKVETFLELLPESTIDFDESGHIVAFVGFSLKPANHSFFIGVQEFYTWCVIDALFLPSLLQTNARLVTSCPATGSKIEVNLTNHTVLDASPSSAVVSLVATTGEDCCNDIRGVFCNHVNLFQDQPAFDQWSKGKDGIIAVPLKEAFAMALQRNDWRYPDINWKAKFLKNNENKYDHT